MPVKNKAMHSAVSLGVRISGQANSLLSKQLVVSDYAWLGYIPLARKRRDISSEFGTTSTVSW